MSDHNDMMMDLFRSEVESHAESLTAALLALEQDATATHMIDGMMRAAHSVKGAARIVQIEPAVQVSHVMEDCFVAAQRGEIVLRPSGIDVLLKGVDMLSRISEESRQDVPNWGQLQPKITQLVQLLEQVRAGQEPSDIVEPVAPKSNDVIPPKAAVVVEPVSDVVVQTIAVDVTSKPAKTAQTDSETIYFPEYLDANAAEKLRQEFVSHLQQPAIRYIHLDLSATTDMDAVGLAFIDALAAHATSRSTAEVVITAASPAIERVIRCLDAKTLLSLRS